MYTYSFGEFDLAYTPLAQPETSMVAYVDPKTRDTLDLNDKKG